MLGSQLLLCAPDGVEALGTDLAAAPPPGGPAFRAPGVDLAERAGVERLLDELAPLAGVIHAAAYTAVDRAEEQEELALRVNGLASGNLAAACAERGLPLVLVSTDFVFDGSKGAPYVEDDPTAPLGVYGRSKLEGERLALEAWREGTRIARTAWLYGPRGGHFPGTILRLAGERDELRVVDDQVGCPTTTLELAPALWDLLALGEAGIWHAVCEGRASWYDLAVATLRIASRRHPELARVRVQPCTSEEFPRPAPRPANSVLDCSRLSALRGRALKGWEEALEDYLESSWPETLAEES
jgi:dTDP-4-dehydrorhamnose reductase